MAASSHYRPGIESHVRCTAIHWVAALPEFWMRKMNVRCEAALESCGRESLLSAHYTALSPEDQAYPVLRGLASALF